MLGEELGGSEAALRRLHSITSPTDAANPHTPELSS